MAWWKPSWLVNKATQPEPVSPFITMDRAQILECAAKELPWQRTKSGFAAIPFMKSFDFKGREKDLFDTLQNMDDSPVQGRPQSSLGAAAVVTDIALEDIINKHHPDLNAVGAHEAAEHTTATREQIKKAVELLPKTSQFQPSEIGQEQPRGRQ